MLVLSSGWLAYVGQSGGACINNCSFFFMMCFICFFVKCFISVIKAARLEICFSTIFSFFCVKKKRQWRLRNCGNTTEATTLLQQFQGLQRVEVKP